MEVKQKIPGAMCFISFTDTHNAFCARAKEKVKGMKLTSFTEFAWTESSELADKPEGEPTSEVVVAEYKADYNLYGASILTAHEHGNNVTLNLHDYCACTFKIGRYQPVYGVSG